MAPKVLDRHVYSVTLANASGSTAAFKRILAKEAGLKEGWYQQAIASQPELVIGVCRGAGLIPDGETWSHWATEFQLDAGFIDLLLLSSYGRVGIVETKLAYNPDQRREVVAQVLDYALALREMPLVSLPSVEDNQRHDVEDALRAGKFVLIVAGDEMDPRALRLGEAFLAGHLTSEWDLAMIDLNLYKSVANETYLLVPELRGTVIHETRQVVRIQIEGTQPKAKVQIERLPDPSRTARTNWDQDRFVEALATSPVAPEFRVIVDRLIQMARTYRGAGLLFGSGKTGSMTLRRADASIISLYLDGRAEAKPRSYVDRALGPRGSEIYRKAITELWGSEFDDGWRQASPTQVVRSGSQLFDALDKSLQEADLPSSVPAGGETS